MFVEFVLKLKPSSYSPEVSIALFNIFTLQALTSDWKGESFLSSGSWDVWGGAGRWNDHCTGNAFYGCSRVGTGEHLLNPIMSGRLRTLPFFGFRYLIHNMQMNLK